MWSRLFGWPISKQETEPARGTWVLTIRTSMGPRPHVDGDVCEWDLTLIAPRRDRECRIDGIWFLASVRRTLEARDLIERMRGKARWGRANCRA